MSEITYRCPHCGHTIIVESTAGDTDPVLSCPYCEGQSVGATLAPPAPEISEPVSFHFREDEETYTLRRIVPHTRKANGCRIALWALFLALSLVGKLLHHLTNTADGMKDTPLGVVADVAGVFFWFLVCYAIDRILSAAVD